ncbi:MAG: 5' nucleotidase, NT5C type [Acidiferrobacterales bacterium]
MRLLIDMDQVICKWLERILEYYNYDKKTNVQLEDVKSWNVVDTLGPNSEDFIRSCMRYPELYRDLDPVEGAIEGIKKLQEQGHDVIIATAVPKSAGIAYHGKLEWIRRNMPFFSLNNFVAIQRKDLLQGDILLDDGAHNIRPFRAAGRRAIVFDRPWNRDEPGERVKTWEEFVKLVEESK